MMDQEKEDTEQSDAVRKEFEAQCNKELLQGKASRASSTNSFNTVSTPVNDASAPRTFNDIGPSFVPLGGSFPLDVNDPPDDPLMPDLEDTAEVQHTSIFGIAYDDDDLDTCNSPYADQVEPTKIAQALDDESWVEAMQKELLQFKIQKHKDTNKKKALIMMRFLLLLLELKQSGFMDPEFPEKVYKVEKALYGLHQAPRAWYENRSTYLLDNGLYKGQIDKTLFIKRVKGDILLMSSMGELTFFLGLQVKQKEDGIFISQDKYVGEILKKFGFSSIRTASTPMETNKALTKGEDVKRIFRYLKGRPKLGLWYPKDSPFILEAFSDSDYAGASLDRKSTTGGCQFLGSRLISWQCKKQTVVANSTTEVNYIAASQCCGQVLWIQNQLLDYGYNFMQTKIHVDNESAICVVKNPVYHSKTKHIEIRHHFIRDSYEKRLIEMVKIHTDNNVADLLTKAFDVSRINFLVASICVTHKKLGSSGMVTIGCYVKVQQSRYRK
ncbi:putative ribonuclease H-like domain-containing protein [Tanacetum coccineum]